MFTKKNPTIKVIKFNMDKSIDEINAPVNKSIFHFGNEGWEANPKSFTEINKDKLYGFIKGKEENLIAGYIVRENDPTPLHFRVGRGGKKDQIYSNDIVDPDRLVYHEDESFARKVSEVENKKGKGQQEFIVWALGIVAILLAIGFLIGISVVGLPNFFGGGGEVAIDPPSGLPVSSPVGVPLQ